MRWELNIPALDLAKRMPGQSVRPITKGEPRMDEAAFQAFYEETSCPLFAYLLRVSGERTLAEDLLQESYCRLLSAKLSPMDEVGRRSYLFRIATNLLRDRWRSHKESSLPDPVPEVASSEGASHKEIADSTGLKAGSVRLLLFRARRKLADLIGGSPRDSGSEVD